MTFTVYIPDGWIWVLMVLFWLMAGLSIINAVLGIMKVRLERKYYELEQRGALKQADGDET